MLASYNQRSQPKVEKVAQSWMPRETSPLLNYKVKVTCHSVEKKKMEIDMKKEKSVRHI